MRFDLIDLRLFLFILETGSITHGAERTHLALAAASTRIRRALGWTPRHAALDEIIRSAWTWMNGQGA